jgi:hypothetical protein
VSHDVGGRCPHSDTLPDQAPSRRYGSAGMAPTQGQVERRRSRRSAAASAAVQIAAIAGINSGSDRPGKASEMIAQSETRRAARR